MDRLSHLNFAFSVSKNYLRGEGAKILADMLSVNSSMNKLKINKCELPIHDLKNGTEVDLSDQGLLVEDAIIIAACIKFSTSLNSLK